MIAVLSKKTTTLIRASFIIVITWSFFCGFLSILGYDAYSEKNSKWRMLFCLFIWTSTHLELVTLDKYLVFSFFTCKVNEWLLPQSLLSAFCPFDSTLFQWDICINCGHQYLLSSGCNLWNCYAMSSASISVLTYRNANGYRNSSTCLRLKESTAV